jgi:hypothetical protein
MCERCMPRRSFLRHGAGAAVALASAPYVFRPGELEAVLQSDRPDLEMAWRARRFCCRMRVLKFPVPARTRRVDPFGGFRV